MEPTAVHPLNQYSPLQTTIYGALGQSWVLSYIWRSRSILGPVLYMALSVNPGSCPIYGALGQSWVLSYIWRSWSILGPVLYMALSVNPGSCPQAKSSQSSCQLAQISLAEYVSKLTFMFLLGL